MSGMSWWIERMSSDEWLFGGVKTDGGIFLFSHMKSIDDEIAHLANDPSRDGVMNAEKIEEFDFAFRENGGSYDIRDCLFSHSTPCSTWLDCLIDETQAFHQQRNMASINVASITSISPLDKRRLKAFVNLPKFYRCDVDKISLSDIAIMFEVAGSR